MDIEVNDGIGRTLNIAAAGMAAHVMEAARRGAEEMQAYAQANAPWSDITGNARSGLEATVSREGMDIVIDLHHSVDYGIWLETIQDGEYAIILPTIEALGPQVLDSMGGIFMHVGELGGGDF